MGLKDKLDQESLKLVRNSLHFVGLEALALRVETAPLSPVLFPRQQHPPGRRKLCLHGLGGSLGWDRSLTAAGWARSKQH